MGFNRQFRRENDQLNSDLELDELNFKEVNDDFCMEMVGISNDVNQTLYRLMQNYIRIYEVDEHEEQGIDVEIKNNGVRFSGNVLKALDILREQNLISQDLFKMLKDDLELQSILKKHQKTHYIELDQKLDTNIETNNNLKMHTEEKKTDSTKKVNVINSIVTHLRSH